MNRINSLKNDKYIWLLAFLLLLNIQPYFVWHIGKFQNLIITVLLIGSLFFHARKNKMSEGLTICWVFVTILASFCARNNVFGFIMLLTTSMIFAIDSRTLAKTYRNFYLLYTSLIAISIIIWILVVLLGVNIPYKIVDPLISIKEYNYSIYPLLVRTNLASINYESMSNTYRFCGIFDEPGVVGTISFLLLFIEKFNFKKRLNLVLLLSGIISMSLFFYLASIVYILLFLFTNNKVSKKMKLLSVLLIFIFLYASYFNEVLYNLVWQRVEDGKSVQNLVDSRSSQELKAFVDRIAWSSDFYFGVSDRTYVERFSSSASIYNIIINYGLVPFIFYLSFFFFYSLKYSFTLKNTIICVFIIFLTLIQRPGLFLFYFLFLFRCLIVFMPVSKSQRLSNLD